MVFLMSNDNRATLDLVAHFLGIVTHDNINAAPSAIAAPRVASSAPASGASGFR